MSGVSFARSNVSLDTEGSEGTYRGRLASRQTGDVFTIPSVKSSSGYDTKSVTAKVTELQLDKNPFKIPSDIDIFLLRDKQREKAKVERERRKTLKVHEKMTCSTLQSAKQSGFKKEIQMEEEAEDKELAAEAERLKALRESISWKIAVTKDQVVERETMHDYINQKRQMFLLQYAVIVKKDEIQKLDNLAVEEEAKLEKAEEDLEKDAAMFDEFLKENDRNSAQALKIAEKETKAKLEKILEIRELTAQMMNIQSEIARFEDTLKEYVVFKDFLYQLSPKEWRDDYEKKRMKEKEKVVKIIPEKDEKLSSILSKSRDIQQKRKGRGMSLLKHSSFDLSATDLSSRTPSQILTRKDSIRMSQVSSRQNLRSQQSKRPSIIIPATDENPPDIPSDEEEDEEPELYFTDPHQLLNVFTELEEQNLSLIQNSQETEENLDELRHTLTATRNKMDREIEQLKLLAVTLQANIVKEEETAADLELKARVFSFGEYKADVQDKMLVSLHRKVLEVYRRCIGENEANLGTVQMLTVIEHQLDDLLECLERVAPAKIEQAEKAKEKERRMRMREEKIRQQRQLQEERLQRALARAQADVKKKSGRRLVFRSEPPAYKEKEDEDQGIIDKEKEELLYYFT
ncbi:cilia- and flagella-associated protein 100 [Rhineura floridana]|uniref:cilia- and flagella-associated protein 100 n=1 Tax=Rhineura floridana TaxID=261503 RepID=UPI002AC7F06B|nr:cilia- and flagella-associated protein 100 [Rhineura floridana]XP_061474400.1 cilia- and flagella-associated protein 100 [Rhineura floridana]XP_061474401.1 cilia- and flagella-associated protein 100 [Rhineura floridana]XP_061474402.1 cilia- and flagella-associated protein 100 [Rhineura floridana]